MSRLLVIIVTYNAMRRIGKIAERRIQKSILFFVTNLQLIHGLSR